MNIGNTKPERALWVYGTLSIWWSHVPLHMAVHKALFFSATCADGSSGSGCAETRPWLVRRHPSRVTYACVPADKQGVRLLHSSCCAASSILTCVFAPHNQKA